ncbi:lipoprotein-releasing ABC transporter permease subunit [Rheinheimera sp.]|uniref:lipoprotein-releasing ABC transporter permease subunit n=1 Tax=Rheinheimera sp. TaxID=1869214 RepID=UPI0025E87ABE|nr:lipoprotein-releasing ABC transporter permease subunit [Rheinheimera sp.]
MLHKLPIFTASLSWQLARRYRHTRNSSAFIRFISASSTWGIGLGVAILILALSVMNGFEAALKNKLLSVIPHVELLAVDQPIKQWQPKLQQLVKTPGVVAGAPFIQSDGMLRLGSKVKAASVRGIHPQFEHGISRLGDFIQQGDLSQLGASQIVLGQGIATELSAKVGDTVQLMLPQLSEQGELASQKNVSLEVVAIAGIGGQLDYQQVWVDLDALGEWLSLSPGQVEGFAFKIQDIFQAGNIARELGNQAEDYVYMLDWFRTQGHLYQDIQMVRSILYLVLALVIAVACFNIVATLVMAVREKESDIAILLTMGTEPGVIVRAFMWLGWLNGVKGTVMGALVGIILAWQIEHIYAVAGKLFGLQLLDPTIYFIDYLPSELHVQDVLLTVGVALLLSLMATLYPASRAAYVEPARVLGQR